VGDARTGSGLHLYSSDRAEALVSKLVEVLVDDPLDPMEAEWLAVPSDGMRRWVTLELARHLGASGSGTDDGVAANFRRAYPGSLRNVALDAQSAGPSTSAVPADRTDPWHIDRMVWPLLAVFDDLAADGGMPEFTALPDGASRFTRVRTVADLFDRYHLHRPEMVCAWADPGRGDGGMVDGLLEPISVHANWQPRLWRLLREEIRAPSPPERMADVLHEVGAGVLELDLPGRLLLFGFTSLPGRDFLPLVEAVARERAVHLFLLEPHRFDPDALRTAWPVPSPTRPRLRSEDPTGQSVRQPLLRSWGRLPRESAVLLADGLVGGRDEVTWVSSGPPPRTTVLERLQADIRQDAPGVPDRVDASDRSVQFHACFGAMRQVQVARDAILHLLNDADAGLTEEDVLVVCPNLEKFAPLVEAVFGRVGPASGEVAGAPALRYRIADRSIRSANPVMGATAALLELVAGRFEISGVLDFISLAPVRARFGLDDDDLGVLAEWAEETRVRWGLDPGHRARFGLPESVETNTWQAALDRLLLGSAVADGDLELAIGGVAPFGVDSGDTDLLGTFAFILGRLAGLAGHAAGTGRTVGGWSDLLRQTGADLFAAPDQEAWQFEALERVLREVVDSAGGSERGGAVVLGLLDLRRLLEGRLDAAPGRPDFFRGGVTVTSLASLRWVPFRVVCLLGLDQDALGSTAPDASDLVAAAPQPGDPDPRSETRQWMLEAVLAARDHLLVVREGRDVRSGHPVPQVVPAAELFDAVVGLHPEGEQPEVRLRLEVEHPRHPFDEVCLEADTLRAGGPWSFARRDLAGARGRRTRPMRRPGFLGSPLVSGDEGPVELDALRAFLRDPVGTFVSRTLQATLPRSADDVQDILPVEPDGLEKYHIGQNLLDARLRGTDDDTWRRVERAKGALPPGVLEDRLFADVSDEVDAMLTEAVIRGVGSGEPVLREVDVIVPEGTRIVGTVPLGLVSPHEGPGRILFSRPKEAYRLEAWLDLMVLVATDPTVPWRSVVVTRTATKGAPLHPIDLVPVQGPDLQDRASDALGLVVDLYRKGLTEPLPLFASYSPAVHGGGSADDAWKRYNGGGDGTGPAVRLVFGDVDVDEIDELPPLDGDPAGVGNRAERFAHHLWGTVDATVEQAP
jgi:exodeoxyribonuclease V gamma subunit